MIGGADCVHLIHYRVQGYHGALHGAVWRLEAVEAARLIDRSHTTVDRRLTLHYFLFPKRTLSSFLSFEI